MYAGITIMHYPPSRTEDVYAHIRDVLIPHHEGLRSEGLKDALFLVNPESCQGIGIAIWDDPKKLRDVEQGNTRDQARAMRDPAEAPTEYARLRAQWVEDLSGGIVSTDWYEVVGRPSSSSETLFPSAGNYRGKGKYAGITIMHYPPSRTEDVYAHIRDVLVPHHEGLRSEGLKDALFLVNPESCQGIGIAIWDDPKKLRDVEQGNTRDQARAMRDPAEAPTEYARLRAQWVEDLSGGIVSTDWYEIVGQVGGGQGTSGGTSPYKGKAKPATTSAGKGKSAQTQTWPLS